jgi:hypothetical protein
MPCTHMHALAGSTPHHSDHTHGHGLPILMNKINDCNASNIVQDDYGCIQLKYSVGGVDLRAANRADALRAHDSCILVAHTLVATRQQRIVCWRLQAHHTQTLLVTLPCSLHSNFSIIRVLYAHLHCCKCRSVSRYLLPALLHDVRHC